MNTILINILLTTLGLTGSLAAFGGKTWVEGDAQKKMRITKRGYLSLFCLLSAFGLGIIKEVSNNKVIDSKDDKISQLTDTLSKVQTQLASYKDILNEIKTESHRQEQVVMSEYVYVNGVWDAPNFLYPGSVIKFYRGGSTGDLKIRYGNDRAGYTVDVIYTSDEYTGIGIERPYEIPIVGVSGQPFQWHLIGNWRGKVFVYSSPRQREIDRSWEEERQRGQ